MEIIIIIAILGAVAYWAYQHLNKEKSDGSHPLDAATKPKTSWPFPGGEVGEGKIHVKVADVVPVTSDSNEDRVEAPAPVAEPVPAKKPAAKKAPAKTKTEPKSRAARKPVAK
jgi:hypothetical protein